MARVFWLSAGLAVLALHITACSPAKKPPATAAKPPPAVATAAAPTAAAAPAAAPSTVQGIIEDMTGKTTVDAGRRAQDKIKAVSAERNKDLEEALGK